MSESRTDFEPTEAELAEAAAVRDRIDSGQVEAAVAARSAQPAPPRAAPRTGRWYGCVADSAGDAMVTEHPYSDPELARRAALETLPNGPDVATLVAVQAPSRDAALDVYEAIEEVVEVDVVPQAVSLAGPRVGLLARRTKPVAVQELLVGGTGLVHASEQCRFVVGREVTRVPAGDLLARMVAGEVVAMGGATYSDYCGYCAVTE